METLTRRDFLRLSAVTIAGLAARCEPPPPGATPATSPDFSPTPPVETLFLIPPSLEGKLVGENDPDKFVVENAVRKVGGEAMVAIGSEPIRVGDRAFRLWDVWGGAAVDLGNGSIANVPIHLTTATDDKGHAWVYTNDSKGNLYPIKPLDASLDGYTYAPDTTKPAFVQAAVKTINGSTKRYWASIIVDGVPTQKEEFGAASKLFAEVKPDFNDPTTVKKLNQWLDTRWLSDYTSNPDVVDGVVSEGYAIVAAGNLASRLNRSAETGGSETVQDGNLVITDKKQQIGEAKQLTLSLARVEEVAATNRSGGVTLINVKASGRGNVFGTTEKRLVYYKPTVVNELLKEVVWSDETGDATYITKGSAVLKVVGQNEDGTHKTIPVDGVSVDNLQITTESPAEAGPTSCKDLQALEPVADRFLQEKGYTNWAEAIAAAGITSMDQIKTLYASETIAFRRAIILNFFDFDVSIPKDGEIPGFEGHARCAVFAVPASLTEVKLLPVIISVTRGDGITSSTDIWDRPKSPLILDIDPWLAAHKGKAVEVSINAVRSSWDNVFIQPFLGLGAANVDRSIKKPFFGYTVRHGGLDVWEMVEQMTPNEAGLLVDFIMEEPDF